MGKPIQYTEQQLAWFRENYANTANEEICRHLGVSLSSVQRLKRRYRLKKDKEFMRLMQQAAAKAAMLANTGNGNTGKQNLLIYGAPYRFKKGETGVQRLGAEGEARRQRKAQESYRETIRKERLRINWGLPQRTRLKLVGNARKRNLRYSLKRRGYQVQRAANDVYITPDTQRSITVEQHAAQSGFTIHNT